MTLTGRTRYRTDWFGRLILQLEYKFHYLPAGCMPRARMAEHPIKYEWRDATIADALAGRVCIDPASEEHAA